MASPFLLEKLKSLKCTNPNAKRKASADANAEAVLEGKPSESESKANTNSKMEGMTKGEESPVKSTKSKSKRKAPSVDSNLEVVVKVDHQSHKPTDAWRRLRELHVVRQLSPDTYLLQPRKDNTLRFVCLSDTHGVVEQARREFHKRIPDGDVLVHCGDFSMGGDPSEILAFNSFIRALPHPVKLVIAGNHEMTFEGVSYGGHPQLVRKQLGLSLSASEEEVAAGCKALLEHMLYLEDESVSICGIKIYGSPWVPAFGSWGFSMRRGEKLLEKWNQIPSDTDILVTHGPPCGYGDDVGNGQNKAGCVELLNTVVQRVKPKFHVFGHIHAGHGMWTNGKTTFINCAICSNRYKPDFDPIIFDYPLPQGYTRQDFERLSTESFRQARAMTQKLANESVCDDDHPHTSRQTVQRRVDLNKELRERHRGACDDERDNKEMAHGRVDLHRELQRRRRRSRDEEHRHERHRNGHIEMGLGKVDLHKELREKRQISRGDEDGNNNSNQETVQGQADQHKELQERSRSSHDDEHRNSSEETGHRKVEIYV